MVGDTTEGMVKDTEGMSGEGMVGDTFILVTARNESERLGATLDGLRRAFPGAPVWVADDGSNDGTSQIALAAGATAVRNERPHGKGAAATLTAQRALQSLRPSGKAVAVLCDGDLGASAERLAELAGPVRRGETDLAVAAFARRNGGGLGVALGFARWGIRRRSGLELRAPISGQRAMRVQVLEEVLPFAPGFGMEMGMTIDAARAGYRVCEVTLDLEHRATGRTLSGFLHRGRQLAHFTSVYRRKRR